MSRDIKFRAWNKKTKRMLYADKEPYIGGGYYMDAFGHFVDVSRHYPDGTIDGWDYGGLLPLQFTGLKDKNGVEIYEGDVVAIAFWNGVDMADVENGVIKWHEESSAFKWFSGEPSDANNYWLSHADTKHREVIGNIYENPELSERLGE